MMQNDKMLWWNEETTTGEKSYLGNERVVDLRVVRPFRLQCTNPLRFTSVPVLHSSRSEDAH